MRRPENMTQADFKDLRKKIRERDKALLKGKMIFMSYPTKNDIKTQEEINRVQGKTVRFKGKVYTGESNMKDMLDNNQEEE